MSNINDFGMPFTSQAGDRAYSALDWRSYFRSLLEDGVIGDIGYELMIKPQATPNKTVFVDTGAIFINGAMRVMEDVTNLSVADNTSGQPRIDRIVARLNLSNRKIEFAVRQGSASESPSPPELIQNSNTWELSLAQVYLANGFSTITTGVITDERGNEEVCGYFRYRAKPAWYPVGGTPPLDAWMYSNFKDQLSASELADIEGNSSLMTIINSGEHYKQGRNLIQLGLFNGMFNYASDDETISSDTSLSEHINVYNNLTINAGITLSGRSGVTYIFVKETLTINGTISASGKGSAGGAITAPAGSGGNGGGILIILARKILGSGSIKASGADGGDTTSGSASTTTSTDGTAGSFKGLSIGAGTSYLAPSAPDATRMKKAALAMNLILLNDSGGAGGASGGKDDSSTYYSNSAGAGGSGIIGQGGAAYRTSVSGNNGSPGGGGGGGAVVVLSMETIPAITIEAKGGNAGAIVSQSYANPGGGGGGGLISIMAPGSSATTNAAGGNGGAPGVSGVAGGNGGAGLVEYFVSV
ncbi:hypothetical protein [Gudongella oleilytica]|uniref:hypothetical protein n=1 Tax=Gudongella oleilytica TaxID=1582259 RepID=UPI000FF8B271|nr:hypothetical protein [Gudongella oleilytica]